MVSKVLGTTGGDPVASGYSQGVGIKLASASSQYWQGPIANRPASFPISFVASFVVNNLSVAARLFTSGMASNYAGLCFWVTPAGSAYLGYGNDTTDQHDDGKYFIFTADGAIVVGKPYAFAATIKSGSITLFVNGSPVTGTLSGSASTIVNNGAPLVGRLDYSGSSYYCDATVGMVALGDLDLPSSELQSLSENPWQIFAPDPRRLYFAPSGGGATIFESTFADSWSLSDTYSASANLVSTYADSPTIVDSSSSSAVFSSAFDETIPVSDGPSADMGGTANRTQEESFTITDAYSANLTAVATISETLSAEASASASAIFNATFAETLPIVDGEEADAGRISDIAENVTVTDAYTAGIVAQATQAESVTTSDTYDTIAIYNPTLEETLPITDAVGATLTVPTSGTVDLSQESIDALALEIMNQLTSVPVRRL